ncbi:hypothetical protein LBU01_07090 [Lentilactobacillus buchneri]|nr:hypothetical protein LBU01_07090 [Lentilactobacillus buchneri]
MCNLPGKAKMALRPSLYIYGEMVGEYFYFLKFFGKGFYFTLLSSENVLKDPGPGHTSNKSQR